MSFETLAWAGRVRGIKPTAKLTLLALASCAGADHEAHPSTAWMVDFTGLDRKTVIGSIDALQGAGLVVDTGARRGATHQIKVYRLLAESLPKTEPSQKRNSTTFPRKGSQKRDTELVREPVEIKATPSSPAPAPKIAAPTLPDWVPADAWAGFVDMRKRNRFPLTERAMSITLAELRKLADDGHPPGAVLDQSTQRGWRGVFGLKEQDNGRQGYQGRQHGGGQPTPRVSAALELVGGYKH